MKSSHAFPLLVSLIACFFLVACANSTPHEAQGHEAQEDADHQEQEHAPSPLKGDANIRTEIARVAVLVNDHTATEKDLTTLEGMLASDEHALDEFEEVKTMLSYGEYVHAGHALGFLDTYIETGEHPICPGHELAHFYVFTKHGNAESAEGALDEAREMLPEWEHDAEHYLEEYPGPQSYEQLDKSLHDHIDAIENGETTASDADVDSLANMLCVEA